MGVIEIVQDLSDEFRSIFNYQVFVVTTRAVMLVLFLVLIFVVKRGEAIIE